MKKALLLSSAFAVLAVSVFGAVTIKYVNKDAKAYDFEAKVGTSPVKATFAASKTATITLSGNDQVAYINTPCGMVTVKNGASITISKGCISIVSAK
jgi:hypothetical protein